MAFLKRRWKLALVLGLVVVLVGGGIAIIGRQRGASSGAAARTTAAQTPLVKVYTVKRASTDSPATYSGDVRAVEQVRLVPKVSGRVDELRVAVGDAVKASDIVAVIDHAALDAQVRQAQGALTATRARYDAIAVGPKPEALALSEASLRAAQKGIEQAKNALWAIQNDRDGVCSLTGVNPALPAYNCDSYTARVAQAGAAVELAKAQEVVAQRQLELARATYVETDLVAARGAVEQAEAALDLARTQQAEAFVRAPIAGIVSERSVSVGAMVGPTASIMTIVSRQIKVDLAVEEGHLAQFTLGLPVSLTVAAYPGVVYTGTVSRLAPTADERTRAFAVEVAPADADGRLRAGMFATISIESGPRSMRIPLAAVAERDGAPVAFLIDAGKAVARPLTLGERTASDVEVVRGLAYGEQVVLNPPATLKTGDTVQVDMES